MQTSSLENSAKFRWRACVDAEQAAQLFGWPNYYIPILTSARHLRPLGKPVQNARKWYALVELEELARDREWLDRAVKIVSGFVCDKNLKQRSKRVRFVEQSEPG